MKIKIRMYLLLIFVTLLTLFLVYQKYLLHIPEPVKTGVYPASVRIQKYIEMFCCALFSLPCFFWINTEFRYDDRETVYKKNLKYIVFYVAVFAVLLTVSMTLDWLRYSLILYLAVFLVGLMFAVLGIEAAMSFNRKHPPKLVAKENVLSRCLCCAAVIMPILICFGEFSKFKFNYLNICTRVYYGPEIIVFYFHCVLAVSFYKIARKLYSNGNNRVVSTCFPLILIVYIINTIGTGYLSFVAFENFAFVPSFTSPLFQTLIYACVYLCVGLLWLLLNGILEILICLLGILLAKSVHKKADKEKQALES